MSVRVRPPGPNLSSVKTYRFDSDILHQLYMMYHKLCGGRITFFRVKYPRCSRCATIVAINDITTVCDIPKVIHQKTCGIKAKRKKYTYNSWKEIS